MKAPAAESIGGWGVASHTDAAMAVTTERLRLVAVHAPRVVLAGCLGMHRDEVVRVDVPRSHLAVVAVAAVVLSVTTATHLAVGGRDALVTLEPIGGVGGSMKPLRRHELAG